MSEQNNILLLFDIDGTLLLQASGEHAQALTNALEEVYEITNVSQHLPPHIAGRTDREIARLTLINAGICEDEITEKTPALLARTEENYRQLCPSDLSAHIAPMMQELLLELSQQEHVTLSLVTGNIRGVAYHKLEAAGLGTFFSQHHGGFGSDHEQREQLPPIARKRAGKKGTPWPQAQTIIIGDTPRDIACARADRLRCFAVATGPYETHELQNADHVAHSGKELYQQLIEFCMA